jgi:Ca2+-binding RTX toxin-like protein
MPRKGDCTQRSGRRTVLRVSCLLGAALAVIAWPAAAHGATAKLTKEALVYGAAPGESNHLTITAVRISHGGGRSISGFRLSDSQAPLTAGAGCTSNSLHTVTCPARGVTIIVAKGDDLNDTLVNETAMRSRLDGGADKDAVVGGSANDVLYGGNGEDTLSGRGGNDTIKTRGRWLDTVNCGSGQDTVLTDWTDRVASSCESVLRSTS